MNFDIGVVIFIGFLVANLAVGLFYGRGIKNIKEYAIGNRNFSTATLTATIVATWMAGSNLSITISETYSKGLYYIIPGLADGISFFIIAYFYAPRMREFLGNLSVADAMGNLYGSHARLITAVSAMIICIGNVAIQFSVCTVLLSYFLGISPVFAIILSSFIVITYSTFGGIKAVTFTDMIQFFTFCIILPMTAFLILQSLDNSAAVLNVLTQNPIFDYKEFFNYRNPSFLNTVLLFLFFIIPGLDPAIFQRISMAKDTKQVSKSFIIAGFIMMFLEFGIIASMGILLLATNDASLDPDSIMTYILDHFMYGEFKGLFVIGIVAMLISTADSYINCSAVLFAHDVCKSVGVNLTEQKKLFLVRASALVIGIIAVLISLFATNLLDLILSTYSFFMPIVSVPLLFAIFGFRSTSKSVLIGMGAGFVTVILFKISNLEINAIIPGMLANMMFLFGSHYLLHQSGGWVSIKDKSPLEEIKLERKRKIGNFIYTVKNFNFISFCKSNVPKEENFYVYFGLLCIISIFSAVYSLPEDVYNQYASLVSFLHYSMLIISTIFITYPVWSEDFKNESVIAISWNTAMAYCLVFVNSLLFIISNFDQTLLTILIINLITLAILLRWQVALFMMLAGVFCSVEFYKEFNDVPHLTDDTWGQFKIVYLLLITSSILIAFLKPKQEYIEATERKVGTLENEVTHLDHEVTNLNQHATHLSQEVVHLNKKAINLDNEVTNLTKTVGHYRQRVSDQQQEIERLGKTAQKILNNVNHELRLPIGNVVNFSDMLWEALEKSDNKLLQELSKEVHKNSKRVSSMILNMLDLATLDVKKVDLQKKMINFSELVEERVKTCRKIYLGNKAIDFDLKIDPKVMIAIDQNYMRQTVDNLVINAISFSETGLISIGVSKKDGQVIFTITDQGKGIPPLELEDIFTPFKMGSNTESKADGRGVGLALCKSAVEAHGGKIKAESDGKVGATLKFALPV